MKYRSLILIFFFGFLSLIYLGTRISRAYQDDGTGRHRNVEITIQHYVWQVISNETGKVICELVIEYNREPTQDEVLAICQDAINPPYIPIPESTLSAGATPQPIQAYTDPVLFLQNVHYNLAETREFTHTITIAMQDMSLNIEVPNQPTQDLFIIVSAYEPEPDYQITALVGKVNYADFFCAASQCRVPLVHDSVIEFWATSSFGDESEHLNAILRVSRENGMPTVEIESIYPYEPYIDSCAQTWELSDYTTPEWARFPLSPQDLNTDRSLYYLAENLIRSGVVDASACPGQGLLANGTPNGCGIERAKSKMTHWQNQYDVMIWSSGRRFGIPPVLIKSIMAWESQFWPANIRYYLDEFGLAQINQYGADVALRWDNDLYQQICSGILSDCNLAYASLPPWMQALMRGGLVRSINSECPTCEFGIDYAGSVQSVPTITRVIRSNCYQTKFIMNEHDVTPNYEDTWKFTLVSYHSGYYCIDEAIRNTKLKQQTINWENVSTNIDPSCIGAVDYIDGLWNSLNTFPDDRLNEQVLYETLPLATVRPAPTPTAAPTPVLAKSQLEVVVFADQNANQTPDEGEWVNGLQVVVQFEDGSSLSGQTENGSVLFDLGGKTINSQATISLPLLFRSKSILIPMDGVVPVIFQVDQSDLLPVLP